MDVLDRIREQVENNPVIIYMKGTPQMPMCGFSSRAVEALKQCGREFAYVNVIADPEIFENLPRFADWPTFPQLYIEGELMGDLYRQGREVDFFLPDDPEGFIANAPMVWGPQPHKGNVFFSDWNSGLWAVRLVEESGE